MTESKNAVFLSYATEDAVPAERLGATLRKYGPRAPSHVAQVYAWRGETEKLFEWLDQAYTQHDLSLGMLQITFPLWAARDDPRYTALLRKMSFPE